MSIKCSITKMKSNTLSMMYHQFITLLFMTLFKNSRIEHEPTEIYLSDIEII